MKIVIEQQADITEKGVKALISKRKLSNIAEVKAEWNNWENCTTIYMRPEGSHTFDLRFQKSKSGKIKEDHYNTPYTSAQLSRESRRES